MQSYQDLIVWQKAIDLVVETYRISQKLPRDERFGLTSQMRRAAVSIPANIAEGHGRHHRDDYRQFLSIARGSLKELETHFVIAERLGFLTNADLRRARALSDEVSRMLSALHRKLR
ncbi:MAG: four helix bundle protein [Gemmatimonadaceae bacterium]